MECKGNITAIARDFETKGILVTLSLADVPVQELQAFKAMEQLSVSIKKYRKKRSLDANAYCWALCSKIAEKVGSSKDEIYEQMLQEYGCFYEDEDGFVAVTVKSGTDMARIGGHWKFYKDNGKFSSYLKIKGSSEYDSAEMSRFIDGIIYEAKELGISTETPDEIERMKLLWKESEKTVQRYTEGP